MRNIFRMIAVAAAFVAVAWICAFEAAAGDPVAVSFESWRECVDSLNGRLRAAAVSDSQRAPKISSRSERERYQECAEKRRVYGDEKAIGELTQELTEIYRQYPSKEKSADAKGVAEEAGRIARVLVETTRFVGKEFKMVGSPLFNNFLVHTGVKKEGFCYQWMPYLFDALSKIEWRYFERMWGGASVGRVTENNAVIVVPRDAPIVHGLVFDAWRGAGKPWWRPVRDDNYDWSIRYNETELASVVEQLKGSSNSGVK